MDMIPDGNSIQPWMWRLSDRQILILLGAIVDGDGTYRKSRDVQFSTGIFTASARAECVFGKRFFLSDLQGLLITHGIPCSLIKDIRGDYYLYLRKWHRWHISEHKENIKYTDVSWGVGIKDNGIFIRTGSGRSYIVGNLNDMVK